MERIAHITTDEPTVGVRRAPKHATASHTIIADGTAELRHPVGTVVMQASANKTDYKRLYLNSKIK